MVSFNQNKCMKKIIVNLNLCYFQESKNSKSEINIILITVFFAYSLIKAKFAPSYKKNK